MDRSILEWGIYGFSRLCRGFPRRPDRQSPNQNRKRVDRLDRAAGVARRECSDLSRVTSLNPAESSA
jgi:hypothetical protein